MLNRVALVGNLTRDPDVRKTQDNSSVCSFTLAVTRNYKNQNGEYDADFINCVAWRNQADYLSSYANKGDGLSVSGRIQTRSYQNNEGQRVNVTEIICDEVSIVNSKNKEQKEYKVPASEIHPAKNNVIITDEDLPFY